MALITKIDHVAIAVKDLDAAVRTFIDNFGFPLTRRGEIEAAGIRNAVLQVGDAALELIVPTAAGTPAAQFLAERGEGICMLSLEVKNLEQALAALSAKGVQAAATATAADGRRLAYVGPQGTHGVLLQLVEPAKAGTAAR